MNLPHFSAPEDHEVCRRIHRQFGTTYYFAARRFSPREAQKVHALYAFVRIPDEWVDNPGDLTIPEVKKLLADWRNQFRNGMSGYIPKDGAMRAFCDVARECNIPPSEAECFMDAMEMDLEVTRYQTFEDLRGYMRGSAAAVGIMMCSVMGATIDADLLACASALGEAMQLANFIRDVGEDTDRGRIYLPLEDLSHFGVSEEDVLNGRMSPAFKDLIRFEIARARDLFAKSDAGIARLPRQAQIPVLLARVLYSQILDRVEANHYDVFTRRARTGLLAKGYQALRICLFRNRILNKQALLNGEPTCPETSKRSAWYLAVRRFTQDFF